jgi:hypothetical protein
MARTFSQQDINQRKQRLDAARAFWRVIINDPHARMASPFADVIALSIVEHAESLTDLIFATLNETKEDAARAGA